jgi:hypothetical protein
VNRAAALVPLALLVAARAVETSTASADPPPTLESPGGVPVAFTSNDPTMRIYVARGDVPSNAPPDAYVRAGTVPLTLRLAPGSYTVEAESPKASTGHQRLLVEPGAPMQVEVRSGDATVKTMGSVLIGLGAVATILGVVAIVSISANDAQYNRFGIGLPLILGGVGGAGIGFGMLALGSTEIRAPRLPPGSVRPTPSTSLLPGLVVRF